MFHIRQQNRIVNIVDQIEMRTLRALFNNATSGYVGELIDVYVQMEASDARIQGMLSARRNAVSRTQSVVTSADDKNEAANAARELVLSNIDHLKWNEFRRSLMDGRIYGVAIFENIWKRGAAGTLFIDRIKQVDHTLIEQETTQFNLKGEGFGQIVLREDNLSSKTIKLDDLPPYKLVKAYRTNRDGYHDLEGIMRSVARWYVIKTFLIRVWAQYAEVYGFPTPIVKVSEDELKNQKSLIKKLLQSVGVNRYGIFLKSMDYELHEAAGTQNSDVFEKYLNFANTEAAIAILGQNLTSEVSGGSFAASETHFKVFEDLTSDDLEYTDEIIQEQIVNPLVRVNFPNLPADMYPTYKSVLSRNIDLQKFGLGMQALSKLVPIPKSYIYEQAQVPEPNGDEEVIDNTNSDGLLNALSNTN